MKDLFHSRFISAVLYGVIVGILVTLVLTALAALFLSSGDFNLGTTGIVATVILVIGSFICGMTAALIRKEKGLIMGIASGFLYYLILVLLSLLILRTAVSATLVIKLGLMCLSSGIGGILGVNRAHKRRI